MPATVDQVTNALLTFGLLTADELDALWKEMPAAERPADGVVFTQLLVARNRLTSFQAKELLAGRGGRLVMGDYVILEEIGAGGMGRVYKARHKRMNRLTALKVMSAAAMKDEAAVKRFQREVRAAALLEHPNIVTAYASGESGNVKYLVMQLVEGGDLSTLVKEGGPLPIEKAVDYALQAAHGLAYAHGEGVVHRDIKPANLLLDKKGVIKILDMGLARIESGDDGLTATEQVMGTVDYMSPEQASNTKSADARADIYSLGCTLWLMLTGKKLYEAESMIARLMAHRDAPLPSLVKARDDAPWPLEQALHRMVAKRVEERFQSMDEVIAALEPFGSGGVGGASPTGLGSSIGHGGPRDQELSAFLKGTVPAAPVAAKPKTPSGAIPAASSPDVGTDPQSRTIAQRPAGFDPPSKTRGPQLPSSKKPSLPLLVGGGIAAALVIGVVGWLAVRGGDAEEAALPATPPRTAVVPPKGPPPIAAVPASIPMEKLDSPGYVWSAPQNLGPRVNNGRHNRSPALSADQLCLIVNTDMPPGGSDLFEHRRATVNDAWGPGRRLTGCDGEVFPWLSGDGLQLWFSSASWNSSQGAGALDIWIRSRTSRDAPWSEPQNLGPSINTSFDEEQPALSPNGLLLAFMSNRPGGQGGDDLWMATRISPTAPFSTPVNLGPRINSNAADEFPRFFSNDGTLLFTRHTELHRTHASALGIVGEIGLPMDGHKLRAPWLASDGATLYFEREIWDGTLGGSDIWSMRRVLAGSPEASAPPRPTEELPPPQIQATAFGDHGYQWILADVTWAEAAHAAEAMGGRLLSINNAAENQWVTEKLLAKLPEERMVWIGGFKYGDNVWRWEDGTDMNFQGWSPGEGNDGVGCGTGIGRREFGAGIAWADWSAAGFPIAQAGSIRGLSRCVGFVVEWDTPTPTPNKPPAPLVFNGHRYLLVRKKLVDWNQAKAAAEAAGGHLLTINSAAERDWVQQRIYPRAALVEANGRFFFGAFADGAANPWQWVTGEPFDKQLWLGNPPNFTGDARSVATWANNYWDDVPPDWRYLPYVIEWDDATAGK